MAQRLTRRRQSPAFDVCVWEYRVEGNSVLDQRVVEKTVYGFLGLCKSIDDVESPRGPGKGLFSVPGYREVERLGVNGSLEFYSPDLGKHLYEGMGLLRFLVFGDLAYLWVKDALPDQPQRFSLASTGARFNIELWRKLNGTLFWSYPFTRTGSVAVGETHVDFRIA